MTSNEHAPAPGENESDTNLDLIDVLKTAGVEPTSSLINALAENRANYLRETLLSVFEHHTNEDMTIDVDGAMEEIAVLCGGEEEYEQRNGSNKAILSRPSELP